MIEVEQRFKLNLEERARLLQGAEFLKEKSFTDVYYDSSTYSLTTKDRWLRLRGDKFELKVPVYEGKGRKGMDQYHEITAPDKIAEAVGITIVGGLKEGLSSNGYIPFASIKTIRQHSQKKWFQY